MTNKIRSKKLKDRSSVKWNKAKSNSNHNLYPIKNHCLHKNNKDKEKNNKDKEDKIIINS